MNTNAHLVPGTVLGRYELLAPIAQGGMATVWAAQQRGSRGLQKTVAIKIMLSTLSEDPQFEQMFLNEALLASRIHHPNVCEILDFGEQDEVLYIAMEWIDGEALSVIHKIARKKQAQLPIRLTLRVITQACSGLHAAHEACDENDVPLQLVHRDVSPQNILVTYDGIVKLVDFGTAKAMGRAGGETRAGQLKGKVPYMSPEQVRGGIVDRRTDVFAIGIVLYKMATGLHPFLGENDLVTMRNIISRPLLSPRVKDPRFPSEVEQLLIKCLHKDPDKRYQTMAEMANAIERTSAMLGPDNDDLGTHVRTIVGERGARRRAAILERIQKSTEKPSIGTITAPDLASVSLPVQALENSDPSHEALPSLAVSMDWNWDEEDEPTQIYDKAQYGPSLSTQEGVKNGVAAAPSGGHAPRAQIVEPSTSKERAQLPIRSLKTSDPSPPKGAKDNAAARLLLSSPSPKFKGSLLGAQQVIRARLEELQATLSETPTSESDPVVRDIESALELVPSSPDAGLMRANKILESVLIEFFRYRIGEPPRVVTLEALLDPLVRQNHIPRKIETLCHVVKELGDFGSHAVGDGEDPTHSEAYVALSALTIALKWFRRKAADTEVGKLNKQTEGPLKDANMNRIRILFLAANPITTTRLDLEEELRGVEQEFRAVRYREHVDLFAYHAVRPDDLLRYVRADRPTIIHFSGHGSPSGIMLRTDSGEHQTVPSGSLRRFLKGRGIELVVLNACFTAEQAAEIASSVRSVIGTAAAVGDEAARRFSCAFYRSLGDGLTVADAFRDGGDAVALHGLTDVFHHVGELDWRPVGP